MRDKDVVETNTNPILVRDLLVRLDEFSRTAKSYALNEFSLSIRDLLADIAKRGILEEGPPVSYVDRTNPPIRIAMPVMSSYETIKATGVLEELVRGLVDVKSIKLEITTG